MPIYLHSLHILKTHITIRKQKKKNVEKNLYIDSTVFYITGSQV